MAATKSSGMDTAVQLGLNEEILPAVQHRLRIASLLAENVRDSELGLKQLLTGSTRPCEAEKAFIPDMFVSFVSQKPRLNVHYEVVKLESEAWLRQ